MTVNTSHCGELYVCRPTESFSTLRKSMFCFDLYVFARKQLSTDRLRVKNSLLEKAGWRSLSHCAHSKKAAGFTWKIQWLFP